MDFGALPPEINSARMYAGPGAGSMLAAAGAWDGLAADLYATATSYGSVVSGLTAESWLGAASMSMAAAAAPYVAWISATAAQCEQVANQARAAAMAYEAAFAMTVPPPMIAANRAQLMALVATNFLGQNTPAIMATEAQYGEMWAQDAAAMYSYAASSAAASTLAPFTPPTPTTNPAGLAGQSAAVAHAAGTSAVTHAHTVASHLSTSLVPQTLQGLAQPLQSSSTSGLSSTVLDAGTSLASSGASGAIAPASAISGLTGMTGKVAAKGAGEGAGAATGLGGLSGLLGGGSSATTELAGLGSDAAGLGTDAGGLGADFFGVGLDFLGADSLFETEGLAPVDGLGALGLVPAGGSGQPVPPGGTGAAAGVGHAASVGALSVPQSWANIPARSITPAGATAFPSANLGATPAMPVSSSGMPRTSPPTLMGRVADSAKFGYRATVVPHSSVAG